MTTFRPTEHQEIYSNGGQVSSSYTATRSIRSEGPPPSPSKLPELEQFEQYMCPICRQIARQVHQASCCHKYFCFDCINKVCGQACPHCRREGWQYEKMSHIDSIIQQTFVECRNNGCKWKGQLYNVEQHTTSTCRVQMISCSDCKQLVQRQDYAAHDCPKCTIQCCHCGKIDKKEIITEHIATTCPEAPIECFNPGCPVVVKRRDMEAHLKDCGLETIPCKFLKVIDCKDMVLREKMADHVTDCLPSHFKLALKQIDCLQEKMSRCNKAIESQILRAPVTFKIDDFAVKKKQNDVWQSPPFYTHPEGYRMCLRVFLNGAETDQGFAISVYLHLMRGPFDKHLKWPFLCVFKVAVLNQLENNNHKEHEIKFINDRDKCGDRYNQKVTGCEMAEIGLGEQCFVCHTQLSKHPKRIKNTYVETEYLKDDCVYMSIQEANVLSVPHSWLMDYSCK